MAAKMSVPTTSIWTTDENNGLASELALVSLRRGCIQHALQVIIPGADDNWAIPIFWDCLPSPHYHLLRYEPSWS